MICKLEKRKSDVEFLIANYQQQQQQQHMKGKVTGPADIQPQERR